MPTERPARNNPPARKAKQANGESAAEQNKTGNLEEAVRIRAYELYLERGYKDGSAQDDWLRAEAEITRSREKRT